MVVCPAAAADPAAHLGTVIAMQQHCTKMRYRMGIIEAGQGSSVADVQAFRAQLSDTRLALYLSVGEGGIAGRHRRRDPAAEWLHGRNLCRTDVQRGVYKAPANEVVRGALRLRARREHRSSRRC